MENNNNRRKCLLTIGHGSGAEAMSISFARNLKDKYSEIYISAPNKYFADALALENSKFISIGQNELPSLFHTIMRDREEWSVLNNEVYGQSKFILRGSNYYTELAKLWNIEAPKYTGQGSTYTPYFIVPENIKKDAQQFAQQHKNFIMFQRQGGINPVTPPQQRMQMAQQPEMGLKRAYPIDKSERLVELLTKKGYEVLQYCLPEEPHIKGTIYTQTEANQLFYHELSKYAKGVITIDSSLLHLSVHNNDNVVAIWNQTQTPNQTTIGFGYDKCKNLYSEVDVDSPYFNGIPSSPYITYVEPETIVSAFEDNDRSTEKKAEVPKK